MKKLSCFRLRNKLFSYARCKDLTEAQREKVKAHIDRCAPCRKEVELDKRIIEICRQAAKKNPAQYSFTQNTKVNLKPVKIRCKFLRYLLAWLEYYKEIIQIERHRIARGFLVCITIVMGGYILWTHPFSPSNFLVVVSDNRQLQVFAGQHGYTIDSSEGEVLVSVKDRTKVKVKTPSVEVEGKKATFFVKRKEDGNTDVGVTYAYDSVGVLTSSHAKAVTTGYKYTISPEGEFSDRAKIDEEEMQRWKNKLLSYNR
ncbi:hypothetical protein ES702_02094 [subsurface metagenome]